MMPSARIESLRSAPPPKMSMKSEHAAAIFEELGDGVMVDVWDRDVQRQNVDHDRAQHEEDAIAQFGHAPR